MGDRKTRERNVERAVDSVNDILSAAEDEIEELEKRLEAATNAADAREEERNDLLNVLDEINELEEHDIVGFGNLGAARRLAGEALKKYR